MDSDKYISLLEQENTKMKAQIDSLTKQVSNLTEMILQMRNDKYGRSSEKTVVLDNQIALDLVFNEIEVSVNADAKEPVELTRNGRLRANPKTKREFILKGIPVKEVICQATEESLNCPKCGGKLKEIGTVVVRQELEYIPASLTVVKYLQTSYECPACKHTDHPVIAKSWVPKSLLPHSLASPSSVANVIYQKYVNSMPLYRQEQEFKNMNLDLSRGTMANWIIRCYEEYLDPIVKLMREKLLLRDILHCDETPVQVLKEPDKKPESKSYMWLYRTGNDGKAPIIIYDYQPSRSGTNPAAFLENFKGYIHSDGYSGYNSLTGITRCGCWAHLRRKFNDAIPNTSKQGETKSLAEIGRDYCTKLFYIESKLEDLTPLERYEKRLELERPILDEFWNWLENINVLNGSAISRAKIYAINQKSYLENYLLDGRLNISNNPAENAIRPFTVGRKNWLFSDTQAGAKASAAIYSLVETSKANGLDVRKYFEYVLRNMKDSDWRMHLEKLDEFLPWSDSAKDECLKNI